MNKFLKVLFFIFLFFALAFFIYYLTLYNDWPLIKGVYIYCAIVGFIIILLIIRKLYLRYKEKRYIKKVIAQDSNKLGSLKIGDIQQTLEQSWYSSVNILSTSLLKTKKDPIHALPWFLVLGNKSSGKSTLLDNITLKSTVKEENNVRENCSWSYFDNAIILNLSSKYLNKGYDLHISKEWEHLLHLMKTTRKKEPINGIIVTISSHDLIHKDPDTLSKESLLIKKRIDEIICAFDAKVPIYIFITKMDKIFGFSQTQHYLEEQNKEAVLGYTNKEYNTTENLSIQLNDALNYINTNLQDLSKEVFLKQHKDFNSINYFSKEFHSLNEKINHYIQSIFDDNLYQYLPKFRGIYLTATPKEDTVDFFALEDPFKNKSLQNPSSVSSTTQINTLFKKILPNDRHIFSFLKLEKNFYFQMFVVVFVSIVIMGWFTLSYKQNSTILAMVGNYQKARTIKENFDANTHVIYQKFVYTSNIKQLYENSFFAKYGYTQGKNLIGKIEAAFNIDFIRALLYEFDNYIEKLVYNKNLDDEQYSKVVAYLLQNIKVHRDVLYKREFKFEDISYANDIVNLKREIKSNLINREFMEIYYNFLKTNQDYQLIKDRHDLMEQHLQTLLSQRSINLHWLISSSITRNKNISLYDFWPNLTLNDKLDQYYVDAAFTLEGKKEIEKYIQLLKEISFHDASKLNYSINEFWEWYNDQFFNRWYRFIKNFNQAFHYYDYSINRPLLLFSMFSKENSYQRVIAHFSEQLKIYPHQDIPKWAQEIDSLNEILQISLQINRQKEQKDNTLLNDLKLKHERTQSKYSSQNNAQYANRFDKAVLLNDYFKSFSKLEFINNNLSNEINSFFSSNKSNSTLSNVYDSLLKLEFSLKDEFSPFAYNLIKGPFDFIMNYAINREACILNQKWNKDVVLPSNNIEPIKLLNELFSQNGLVKQFINQNLENYLTSDDGVTYKKNRINRSYNLPITSQFLRFVTKGAADTYVPKSEYTINIKTRPTSVNKESTLFPYRNELRIDCQDDLFILNNYNYRNEKEFVWKPKSCKRVTVTVFFDNIRFEKKYETKNSFLSFLRDIKNGNIRLTKDHLTTSKALLKDTQLKWIDVYFQLSNFDELLKIKNQKTIHVPRRIAQCKRTPK